MGDLLSQGAGIDEPGAAAWTPLAVAAMGEGAAATDIGIHLLSLKADPDREDRRGRTPLFHAILANNSALVKEMLKTAKKLDTHDGDGIAGLSRAVLMNSADIAKQLIDAGAPLTRQALNYAKSKDGSWAVKQAFGLTTTTTTAAYIGRGTYGSYSPGEL